MAGSRESICSWPILKQVTTKAKKILITTESREVWRIRQGTKNSERRYCSECAQEVDFITIAGALAISRVGSRQIHRWIESGCVHFAETLEGSVLICPYSLAELLALGGKI